MTIRRAPSSGINHTAGGIGEIQVRGPAAMVGYLPETANAEAFCDGWYRTGDIGWVESEGWVHITDRLKEMIKASGRRPRASARAGWVTMQMAAPSFWPEALPAVTVASGSSRPRTAADGPTSPGSCQAAR